MKKLKVVYLKNFRSMPDWMKLFISDVCFYFSDTENEIETLKRISEYLDKFQYKRRNSMCSGVLIKRHIEGNRLYIGNSGDSGITLVMIFYT
jgi:serine/threonine protein phosphatase PrpC